MSGSWTQNCWDRFDWWPLRLGGITLAEGLHDWGRRVVPLLNYTPAFALQLRKSTDNLSLANRLVGDYSLRRIGRLFKDSFDWPAEGQFTSALDLHKCLPSCRTKGFPASAIFESKLSVNALMWSAKNGIPRSSWICLLPMYQGQLVAMRRHLDCNTCSFRIWLRAADLQTRHAKSIIGRISCL
jgi:hypothetical protein